MATKNDSPDRKLRIVFFIRQGLKLKHKFTLSTTDLKLIGNAITYFLRNYFTFSTNYFMNATVLSTFVSMWNDHVIRLLKKIQVFLLVPLIFFGRQASAQKLIVNIKMHHIRQGNTPEWEEFGKHPEGSRLVVHFFAKKNDEEQTL